MKNWTPILLTSALVLGACGDDGVLGPMIDPEPKPPSEAGDGDGDGDGPGKPKPPGDGDEGDGDEGDGDEGDGDESPVGEDAGTDAGDGDGPAPEPWYACQSSDQAFVRNAIMAVLGRRPYSQAEVDVYTDLIGQIDAAEGYNALNAPGSKLRKSRRTMLQALYKDPGYGKFWGELYRDFIRVQRVDETANTACFEATSNPDPVGVAGYIRSTNPAVGAGELGAFTMADAITGSLALDDVTPIYTANLFAMLTKTYSGANAEPEAIELGRRQDFGAWFDAVYLHRDVVCLGCHNSEWSVTGSPDPAKNRHYAIPALLEKSLFGDSMGPPSYGGYESADRLHAPLRFRGFISNCNSLVTENSSAVVKANAAKVNCATGEAKYSCSSNTGEVICESDRARRQARPWGWLAACGTYNQADNIGADFLGVEAKFGNLTGLRTSAWGLSESLRTGFIKLRAEGLNPDADGEVADPDKAFAYLVAMRIAENVWTQIVGTPLTIPTRFPRNEASRNELQTLVEAFIKSGFSNQKLIEAVLASPYANLAPPSEGCGQAYSLPAVFDPWVIAEDNVAKRKNNAADRVMSLPARTAANALYSALGWNYHVGYPNVPNASNANYARLFAERNFQNEVGVYLKNAEPGFRGFDFQARLGWENRFGKCEKLATVVDPDFIDRLVAGLTPGQAKVRDLVAALKDRLIGDASIEEAVEGKALEFMLGATLDADATLLSDAAGGLRKLCGVLVSTPQFMLSGLPPRDGVEVPKLTPASAGYNAICTKLEAALPGQFSIECPVDGRLTVVAR